MHYKQNNKESKSFVQGLRLLGNTLPRGIKGILKKNGYNYSEIISKWKFLVGNEIAGYSYPKLLKNDLSKTLVICVERGNEITLEYSKKTIIDKINSYFGYKLINTIRLETINIKNNKFKNKKKVDKLSKNFEEKINRIKNIEIKKSLNKLLHAMKND
tara:strand:- start:1331 stop:1804 length:474 start_codon:yes stop_codon:yes gene_type:complete